MCDSCGCHINENADKHVIEINRNLLEANQKQAESNRAHIERMGAMAINIISSPGSGKTTLLEKTIEKLQKTLKIGVIEGDIETERDAERIRAKGVPAVQLTTGGACHLDAPMVHKGLHALEDQAEDGRYDIIFIENVGNLVCPATFYLGEHKRVVIVSVPEGSDKPAKYPTTFRGTDLFLISKTDLLPYFNFSIEEAEKEALRLNPTIKTLQLSATSGKGLDGWIHFLTTLCSR